MFRLPILTVISTSAYALDIAMCGYCCCLFLLLIMDDLEDLLKEKGVF